VRGSDGNGGFDYYYDGQDSYELRHRDRTLTLFHPHQHPNSPNNPAKARMALLLFFPLLVNQQVAQELLSNLADSTLTARGGVHTLTLTHHPNEFGQIVTQTLRIHAVDYSVLSSETDVAWRGTFVRYVLRLSNSRRNITIPDTNIAFTQMPLGYKVIETLRDRQIVPEAGKQLLGMLAPDFAFRDLAGQEIRLSMFRGKILLLDFWETWCGHCIASFPQMNSLHQDYTDQGLVILGITTENPELVRKVSAANNVRYKNLLADSNILKNYQITGRPVYVLIDRAGRISLISYGNIASIEAAIRTAIR
jgi:peroxiredoxin